MERYNFNSVEKKWQKYWDDNNFFQSKVIKNKKFTTCYELERPLRIKN